MKHKFNAIFASQGIGNANSGTGRFGFLGSEGPISNGSDDAAAEEVPEEEPVLSAEEIKRAEDFDWDKLVSHPLPGSLLAKFKGCSSWKKNQVEAKMKNAILKPMFGVIMIPDASMLTYFVAHLVTPHSTAVQMAESIGKKVRESDRASLELEYLSALTGKELKDRSDIGALLKSAASRHPWVLDVVMNIAK